MWSSRQRTSPFCPPHISSGNACQNRYARRENIVIVAAKKSGKKGGKKSKKASSAPVQPAASPKPYLSTPVIMQNLLMIESYFRKTGRPLFNEEVEISDVAQLLWDAPFALLAHDTDEDPKFVYANNAALLLFECEWSEIIGSPSRESAAPDKEIQDDRSALLAKALDNGFVDDYEGWRKSFKGTPFKVSNTTIFNIESPGGDAMGQAAVLRLWEYEDGSQGGPLAAPQEPSTASEAKEEEIAKAQEKVDACASFVRELKEVQGLKNSDDEVKQAVEELLTAKQALENMISGQ